MIDDVKRLAGPFTGAGQSTFPFSFKIFAPTDIYVALAQEENGVSTTLSYGTDYTVSMNKDQDGTPGGSVTLTTALTGTQVVAIGSGIPYTQELNLTNYSRFAPESINTELDREVVQIQQLAELVGRAITTDPTDTMTPSELKRKLLEAATDATVVAKGYAESAKASADAAAKSAASASNAVTGLDAKAEELIKVLEGKGNEQSRLVEAEGDEQVRRVEAAAADAIALEGLGGAETSWVLSVNVSAGSAITIADGHKYVVGRHHLRVSWNGVVLYLEKNFNEIGTVDSLSNSFSLTFDVKTGDELDVWIAPLGRKDVADAIATAKSAEEAVAELSRKVVYKNQESAE